MKKMELEVKVLGINKKEFIEKITSLGATFESEVKQYLYTYDLPTIYARFIDIKLQLKDNKNGVKFDSAKEKLKLLFFELDNLLTKKDKSELKKIIGEDTLSSLSLEEDFTKVIEKTELDEFISRFHNNSKKWIRVRKTNDKTTIAVKHILADNDTSLQQMLETEIEVHSLQEAKALLEALGYAHKCYQEKERTTYLLDGYELDIDTWPGIPTYVEIEGESEEDLSKILNKLGYTMQDTVSCTADDVYKKYGLSIDNKRELKF